MDWRPTHNGLSFIWDSLDKWEDMDGFDRTELPKVFKVINNQLDQHGERLDWLGNLSDSLCTCMGIDGRWSDLSVPGSHKPDCQYRVLATREQP